MRTAVLLMLLGLSFSLYGQEKKKVDTDQKSIDVCSMTYWKEHMYDYNLHPEKYDTALALFYKNQQKNRQNKEIQLDRYKKAIEKFRYFDKRNIWAKNPILFVGSSSIVHWETSLAFPEFPIINRGFGGASLPEISYYYDDVIKKYSPSTLVIYCDIDIENGKSPSETFSLFKALVSKVKKDFPKIEIILLSMKPTLIDDFLGKDVRRNKIITNTKLANYCKEEKNLHFVDITKSMLKPDAVLRSDIFLPDGMHMNSLGYTLWNPIIRKVLDELTK